MTITNRTNTPSDSRRVLEAQSRLSRGVHILACAVATGSAAWLVSRGIRLLARIRMREWQEQGGESAWTYSHLAWDAWRVTRGGSAAIAARQQARLANLVAFTRVCSPYYRRLYHNLPAHVTSVRQLPPVTKPELMVHFDEWVTDPAVTRTGVEAFVADPARVGDFYLGRYLIWTTSGTTGVPALLVQDRRSLRVIDILRYVRLDPVLLTPHALWQLRSRGVRLAIIFATGGHFAGVSMIQWWRRTRPILGKWSRMFSVQSPLPELVEELNAFQPTMVEAYATALALLAQEQEEGRLHIQPAVLLSGAESLTLPMRTRIDQAFGCPVTEGYGASEAAAIAFECRQKRLHVNADWVILEPVDEAYQPVPPGQPSHTVLVTNLANRVQPIIRYDLGDSVTVLAEPCPCGSPLPTIQVEGRTDEILAFPLADGQTIHLLPLALCTVVEETPGVRRCQLIQTGPAALTVRLEAVTAGEADAVWQAVQQRLRTYLASQGLATVTIERASEPPQRNPRSGKFRHVRSEWVAVRRAESS
jgi:phenylacetate-CoA ligase